MKNTANKLIEELEKTKIKGKEKKISDLKEKLLENNLKSRDQIFDNCAEIEVALSLYNEEFEVEFIPKKEEQTPDLAIVDGHSEKVYIEISRFQLDKNFKIHNNFHEEIKKELKQKYYDSDIYINIIYNELIGTKGKKIEIINKIIENIKLFDKEKIEKEEKEFKIFIDKNQNSNGLVFDNIGNDINIFKGIENGKEHHHEVKRIQDKILNKIQQIPKNEFGLIIFVNDSDNIKRIFIENAIINLKYGPSQFCVSDIDWTGFLSKLVNDESSKQPKPGKKLWTKLSSDVKNSIKKSTSNCSAQDQSLIIDELNKILKHPYLYNEQDFLNIKLSDEATELLIHERKELSENEIQRLNRILIETIYPDDIKKCPKSNVFFNSLDKFLGIYFIDKWVSRHDRKNEVYYIAVNQNDMFTKTLEKIEKSLQK